MERWSLCVTKGKLPQLIIPVSRNFGKQGGEASYSRNLFFPSFFGNPLNMVFLPELIKEYQ